MSLKSFCEHPLLSIKVHAMSFISERTSVNNNLVVFNNFNGKGYGDSPKYIAEVLHKMKPNLKYYWLLSRNNKSKFPSYFKSAIIDGIHDKYILSRAKIIVTNSRFPLYSQKKKGQFLINTWHGIYGPKYAELAATDTLSPEYVDFIKKNNKDTDLFLAGSNWQHNDITSNFGYNGEIFDSGMPRDDMYFNSSDIQKQNIKKELGIDEKTNILIYCPTFRDSGDTTIYDIPAKDIINELETVTGEQWVLLIRLHPNVPDEVRNMFEYDNKIIESSTYPDIQGLLLVSDLMITDYSSCMFDFIIQEKPVILYVPDVNSKNIRGLRPMFYHLPFPSCKNKEELIKTIKGYNPTIYHNKLQDFIDNYKSEWGDTFVSYDDGKASERVAKKIIENL